MIYQFLLSIISTEGTVHIVIKTKVKCKLCFCHFFFHCYTRSEFVVAVNYKNMQILLPSPYNVFFLCISGGIKKELASARKKVNKLFVILSLVLNIICSFFLLLKGFFLLKILQIANRHDQEKKAYARMFQ